MTANAVGPVTVTGGATGAKLTVPLPLPLLPALSMRPSGRPRLWAGILLPLVSVIFAPMFRSLPVHMVMLPSVVVKAASRFMLRPAPNNMLPLTVVTAALTLISRPQHATTLPFVAVMGWLILMSRTAFSVNVVGLELAVQLTAWLTWMSPLPSIDVPMFCSGGVPGVMTVGPGAVVMVTLLVTSRADSVAPEILSSAPPPMVKSCGSISQVPVCPRGALVLTLASCATRTVAADVSIKPPLPPAAALASSVPATFAVPFCMSASSLMTPPWFSIRWARITPVLLTAVCSRLPAPWVVSSTCPPLAWIKPPLATSALRAPWLTSTPSRLSPSTSSVKAVPPASATVPRGALMVPSLLTCLASRAT